MGARRLEQGGKIDLEVEHTSELTVVRFPEEVDVINAAAIRDRVLRLLNTGIPALLLDLTGTTFLDSAGLHVSSSGPISGAPRCPCR